MTKSCTAKQSNNSKETNKTKHIHHQISKTNPAQSTAIRKQKYDQILPKYITEIT